MPDSLRYTITPVTAFAQNASLLWCTETLEAAIVDPGGDIDTLLEQVDKQGVKLTKILLTHGHIDHVGFTAELARRAEVPIIGPHPDDEFLLQSLDEYGTMLGLPHSGNFLPDQWLQHDDTVKVGNQVMQVIHCPGHTPGHIVFFNASARLAVVGDVLFNGSIGRTDFPRGNHAQLIDSIKQRLLTLGDDIEFVPGHGPNSNFGDERRYNPFLQ